MEKKYQIFVSSTYTDLQEDRQAAVSAILKAGHIPAGMELFTAGNKSQMEIIKRWIDESDIYMLILGGRYGSVDEVSGYSYTELEYEYAVSTGKPLFAVVINEDALEARVKAVGVSVIEQDHPDKLKKFRKKVMSNMCSFFSDEKDIKLAIHETIPDIEDQYELVGWVPGSSLVDTSPLMQEVQRLQAENKELKEMASALEQQVQRAKVRKRNTPDDSADFDAQIDLLRSITVSTALFNGDDDEEPHEYSVFELLIPYRDAFVNGITAKYGSTELEKFLYNQVGAKLVVHGLAKHDKIPGVSWRRCSLSDAGHKLLAYWDRANLGLETAE